MYVKRAPTEVSLSQLDEVAADDRLGPRAHVSQCAFQRMMKISVKGNNAQTYPRIRSFGELSDLGNPSVDGEAGSVDEGGTLTVIAFPEDEKSLMEMVMLAQWEVCVQKGLFRYDVTACSTKTLPGVYGFVAQLNEGRATKKRPTEFRVDKVLQEFDESKFNFTKAFMQEVLFCFDAKASNKTEIIEDANAGRSPDLVMINVSPIEYGHVLLVPRVLDRLIQIVDAQSMLLALQFTAGVGNPYFRLGYNSLGAYATINHLHFQGYYLMAPYPVERAPTKPLKNCTFGDDAIRVSELMSYPVRGWVFEMMGAFDASLKPMAACVGNVCTKLQNMNIPHNLLICDCGARVFLWPQCYAEKQAKGVVPESFMTTGVNPAAFEIAGHVIMKNRQDYEDLSQAWVWSLLSEVSLTEADFSNLNGAL